MSVFHYETISPVDMQALPRDRTMVILNVGPYENHGPHLPLGTDPIQSTVMAETLVNALAKKHLDWNWLFLPPISLGCDTMIGSGSIEISQATLRQVLSDHLTQLAHDGFIHVIALTAHAGPRQFVVLEELAEKVRWRRKMRMISVSSRVLMQVLTGKMTQAIEGHLKNTGTPLTDEERKGLRHDYHGGMLETSVMLALRPDLVRPTYRELRPAIAEKIWRINRKSAKTVGDGLGYLGSPALARAEIGRAAIQAILDDVVPRIERFMAGEDVRKDFRSKFYYVPFFRTDFKWMLFALFYAAAFGIGWMLMLRVLSDAAK